MLCWVFSSLAGFQTCFPVPPDNVLPATEQISSKTNENGFRSNCRYLLSWLTELAHSPLSACTVTGKKKNHFLLMAAMPDTHMAFQQQSAVAFWTELQDSTPAYINRGAHQYAYVRLQTHCLKAKRLFANELSWWQILPFNWLVKEAIWIALHRCSSQKSVWLMLSIRYVWECVLESMTHFRRLESCHSLL